MYLSFKILLNLLQTCDENTKFSWNLVNFFYSFLLKLLLKWSWALTHAEKSQLGMEFRAALTGSSGTSKCLPVEPPAAGIIPQLSFSLATCMAGCTLPFQLKSQTASDWSLTNIEVLLTSCTPSVSRFPETGFLFTWCHTTSSSLSSPCTWILLKWFLKCFPNIEQRCQKKKQGTIFHSWMTKYIHTKHLIIGVS